MKATYKEFKISAVFTGEKPAEWNHKNMNHNIVTVYNIKNGKCTTFDFWGSIIEPELNTEYDILNAFYCFVSDAISGFYSFEEFCDEFCYDEDSRNAERIWKACKKSLAKFKRISEYSENQIYNFANDLSEIAG